MSKPSKRKLCRPVMQWKSGERAGCAACSGGEILWTGEAATRQAIAHTTKTGHETWYEAIQHRQYKAVTA